MNDNTDARFRSLGKADDIRNYFDPVARKWFDVYESTGFSPEKMKYTGRMKYALHLAGPGKGGTAVDLGCGTGHLLPMIVDLGYARAIGVDISEPMLDAARTVSDRSPHGGNITLIRGDVGALQGIPDGSTDLCVALGVIEYQIDDAATLDETRRMLRPGGTAVIQFRNAHSFRSKAVDGAYTSRIHEWRKLAETAEKAGFVAEEVLLHNILPAVAKRLFLKMGSSYCIPGDYARMPVSGWRSAWFRSAEHLATIGMLRLRRP